MSKILAGVTDKALVRVREGFLKSLSRTKVDFSTDLINMNVGEGHTDQLLTVLFNSLHALKGLVFIARGLEHYGPVAYRV